MPLLIKSILLTFTLLITVAGCSFAPVARDAPVRLGLTLSPASLGQTLSVQQHLIVERLGRKDELDTVLEINAGRLTLVGLALGQRVMTLQYDGKDLHTWRHPMLPAQVRGEDVLEDLQLTLWPAAAIRARLPAEWELTDRADAEQGGTAMIRTLAFRRQPVTVIAYPEGRRWAGTVLLDNLRYGYRLTIKAAPETP